MNENFLYRMLTVEEAAEVLAISERQVRLWCADGTIPCYRPGKSTVRIPLWVLVARVSQQNGLAMDSLPKPPPGIVTDLVTMMRDDEGEPE